MQILDRVRRLNAHLPLSPHLIGVQVTVGPAHGVLNSHMQIVESIGARDLYTPPDDRLRAYQRDFELEDRLERPLTRDRERNILIAGYPAAITLTFWLNHAADFSAAYPTCTPENKGIPFHFRRFKFDVPGARAGAAPHVRQDLILCFARYLPPSFCRRRRERILWLKRSHIFLLCCD